MSYHEQFWLDDCPSLFKPKFYRRYVDDTFMLFESADHLTLFLNYLNSKHKNIEFTYDVEKNGALPFLDINILRRDNGFETSLFRKETYTGLTSKFDSFAPQSYKVNLIKTLFNRAYNICSSYLNLSNELEFLRKLLCTNGFPILLIEKTFGIELSNIYLKEKKEKKDLTGTLFIKLPFLGQISLQTQRKIKYIIKQYFDQLDIRIVFTIQNQIGSFFKYKDKLPDELCSSIIYKYTCDACNSIYIGKTIRNLSIRIYEHKGISFRTKTLLQNPMNSNIRSHSFRCDHLIKNDNFKILDYTHEKDLCTLESLYIWNLKPQINQAGSSEHIFIVK
jgi:hypothetical protein